MLVSFTCTEQDYDEILYLNQSRVGYYDDCKRKYYWQFEVGLVPDKPPNPLVLGKAVHAGLAAHFGGVTEDKKLIEHVEATFNTDFVGYKFMPGEREEAQALLEQSVRLVLSHNAAHPNEPFTVLQPEVKGEVKLGIVTVHSQDGEGFWVKKRVLVILVFTTDAIVVFRGSLWLLEHKTAGRDDPRDVLKYEMDLQISIYIYAVSILLGKRVQGALLNRLIKTKTPKFPPHEMFGREDHELEEARLKILRVAKEIVERKLEIENGVDPKQAFYMNTRECFRFGTCVYRQLCKADSPTKRLMFKQRKPDYVDDPALRMKGDEG